MTTNANPTGTYYTAPGDMDWMCERCYSHTEGEGSWVSLNWDNHWEIICADCLAPDEPSARYDIELNRLATVSDLEWWTRHLRSKNWYLDTDWRRFT